jgi:DNA topoisomerase-2
MAIWSLTKEKVDRLLAQIGDKEHEMDVLIKLSVKDLWTHDLDEFIAEWRYQLEDDRKRRRKVQQLGRRASNKLKIGAKGPVSKKRKAAAAENGDDLDDSDFDFAGAKPKVAKVKKAPVIRKVQPNLKTAAAFFGALSPPMEKKPIVGGGSSNGLTAKPRETKKRSAAATAAAAVAAAADSSDFSSS